MPAPTIAERLPDLDALLAMVQEVRDLLGAGRDAVPTDAALVGDFGEALQQVDTVLGEDPAAVAGGLSALVDQREQLLAGLVPDGAEQLAGQLSSLVEQLGAGPIGSFVSDGGTTLVDALLAAFGDAGIRVGVVTLIQDLIGNALPVESLAVLTEFLAAVEELEAGAPADPAALVGFVAERVLAVPGDILAGPWAVIGPFLGAFGRLPDAAAPAAVLEPAGRIRGALAAGAVELSGLAPSDAAAVDRARQRLVEAQADLATLRAALAGLLAAAEGAVADLDLADLVDQLGDALRAVPVVDVVDIGDVRDTLFGFLSQLTDRAAAVDPAQAAARLEGAAAALDAALTGLGLDQARQEVLGLYRDLLAPLGDLSQGLAAVVESMRMALSGLGDAITGSGADQVAGELAALLEESAGLLAGVDLDAVVAAADAALAGLVELAEAVPVEQLTAALGEAFAALGELVAELAEAVAPAAEHAGRVLDTGRDLDFDEVADPVLEQIDRMTATVRALDPARLPATERAALAAAAGVLQLVDFRAVVTEPLLAGYDQLSGPVLAAAGEAAGRVTAVLDRALGLDPAALAAPLRQPYGTLTAAVDGLDPELVLQPVRDALATVADKLERQLDPAQLLAPLQVGFDQLLAAVDGVAPDQLAAPVTAAFDQLGSLLDRIDLEPLLERMNTLEEELFAELRSLLLDAVDALGLPGPLEDLVAGLGPVIEALSPRALRDPDALLQALGATVSSSFRPSTVFAPLDTLYQRMVAAVEALPEADVLAAFQRLGDEVGRASVLVDPARLAAEIAREAAARLPDLDRVGPEAVAAVFAGAHGQLVGAFSVIDPAAVDPALRPGLAQIGLLIGQLDPGLALAAERGRFSPLRQAVAALTTPPDLGALQAAAAPVEAAIEPLVPDFLTGELTVAAVRDGLAALSPARIGEDLDAAFDALTAAVAGLQAAVQPQVGELLGVLGRHLRVLDPTAWAEEVEGIGVQLGAALDAVDPQVIVDQLQAVFDQARDALAALDPTAVAAELAGPFTAAVQAVRDLELDQLDQRLASLLVVVRSKLVFLDPERLEQLLAPGFDAVAEAAAAVELPALLGALEQLFAAVRAELEQLLGRVGDRFAAFQGELARAAGSPVDLGVLTGGGLPL